MEVMTASSSDIRGWGNWFRKVAQVLDRVFLGDFAVRFYYAAAVMDREADEVEILTKPKAVSLKLPVAPSFSEALGAGSYKIQPENVWPEDDVAIYPTPKKARKPKVTVHEPDWAQVEKEIKKIAKKAKADDAKRNSTKPRRPKAK